MQNFRLIAILNLILLFGYVASTNKKDWMYEMKSVTTKSSNTDLIELSLDVERVSRGVFALSGEAKVLIDIAENDNNQLQVTSFRKAHSDGIFKPLPFQMSRRHFYDTLNTFYKDIVMNTLKDCSDLPYFEDKAAVPFEKKTYILDKCQFSQDGLPNHLETGEYKLILSGYGDVEWEVEIVVEVEPNNE